MVDATTAEQAPATHRQPSRKGKKAWRKNVDVSDVQTGLESLRDEVTQGGIISEKTADQLFTTDLLGDADVARSQQNRKQLKADEILGLRSAVPGLDGRKRKAEDTKLVPTTAGSSKKQKNGKYISHKELQNLKRAANNANGPVDIEDPSASHDPWAPTTVKKDPRSFLTEVKPARAPKTLSEAPISLALNRKSIPDVPKPQGGKSYNPLVGDWSALLEREGATAVAAETKRLAAEAAAEAAEAAALAEAAKVEAQEKDEYATDYDSAWESEWDGIASDDERREIFTAKMQKRKTPSERNKLKARKEREARERWEAKQKVKEEQELRIRAIADEASARDRAKRPTGALAKQDNDSDDDSAVEAQLRRRRFGQLPVPEAPLEVVLPDELEDSLRRLKPEGNLLQDRYRNLLVNGKVEVRKRQWQPKQAKKDVTEKWSYKDWKLPK